MIAPRPAPTPVALITGFLGSGKTTLLKALLADPALADTAVLINEFGEVGLDHHLLERIDETTVLLTSGCLCCTIRGELADSLRGLLSRRTRGTIPPFRRIVMETTGLADPYPILSTLHADPVLRHHLCAGAILATVDAVNFTAEAEAHDEAAQQIAAADRIVLTKTDLADTQAAATARALVAAINPTAEIISRADAARDAQWLAGTMSLRQRFRADMSFPGADRAHLVGVQAMALTLDGPIDWQGFALWLTMLQHRHGERILRVKALLDVAGSAVPVAIDGVRHLVHKPTHLSGWPDGERQSRLVFITRDLPEAALKRSLHACLSSARAPSPTC